MMRLGSSGARLLRPAVNLTKLPATFSGAAGSSSRAFASAGRFQVPAVQHNPQFAGCRLMQRSWQQGFPVARAQLQTPLRGFATVTENLGSLGDSVAEGTIVEWVKKPGDFVEADEVYLVVESDKVSVDIRAKQAGVLKECIAQEGDDVAVGAPIAVFDTDGKPGAAKAAAPKAAEPAKAAPAAAAAAAPKAAAAAAAAPKAAPAFTPAAPTPGSAPAGVAGSRGERRVQMSRMRQTISRRLKDAQNINAMLTTFQDVDMSSLMSLRNNLKDDFLEAHGVKLGFMSGFVKAATSALKKFPDVNAVIDGKDVVYRDYVDVSVAVSTPTGLVVPVLRNTENMSFSQVEGAIAALGQKARNNQIAVEDMVGGTFTISNGGVYGSLFGTPIINPPQSAILGMHAINKRPVVVDDQIVIRPMMYVALTYDHRLIDGATAVQFLKHIKNCIEDPNRLLLDL